MIEILHVNQDNSVSSASDAGVKGGEFEPTAGTSTQPSIPLWVSKMSIWQMMAIGGIYTFQIGSLC